MQALQSPLLFYNRLKLVTRVNNNYPENIDFCLLICFKLSFLYFILTPHRRFLKKTLVIPILN